MKHDWWMWWSSPEEYLRWKWMASNIGIWIGLVALLFIGICELVARIRVIREAWWNKPMTPPDQEISGDKDEEKKS